ncbi:SCO2521 family protein [Catellatospora sp. NPDC049609]|uniref:SCO2521 family protein n=1 Tax=Catellatospora sp. NPDC049609 TaxID=3155505 RepID=UPI0034444410
MATTSETAEVVIGEVHTALLQNSTAVSAATTTALLALTTGERVRRSERPIAYAVSPARFTGVDCDLPAVPVTGRQPDLARVRAVGTVASRAVLTGGHVLQGSAFARVTAADSRHRRPWSHYLSRPGVLELVGRSGGLDVAGGHLLAADHPGLLDLGAIGGRTVDAVQASSRVDRRAPFRTVRTGLRWAVCERGGFEFRLVDHAARTIRLPRTAADAEAVAVLCEDIALHDWLLTTLLSLVSRNPAGSAERRQVVARLAPAADYLLHLWMPAARTDAALAPFWQGIEQRPGMTRQWQTNVDRVRDQLALAVIEASVRRP